DRSGHHQLQERLLLPDEPKQTERSVERLTAPAQRKPLERAPGSVLARAVEGIAAIDQDRIRVSRGPRPIDSRLLVTTRVLSSPLRQVLDLPAETLAAVIGSWPEPALLESGPGFG